MTEKEFRKIVFETELPSSKKQEFLEKITNIENIISKDLPSYISFINLHIKIYWFTENLFLFIPNCKSKNQNTTNDLWQGNAFT